MPRILRACDRAALLGGGACGGCGRSTSRIRPGAGAGPGDPVRQPSQLLRLGVHPDDSRQEGLFHRKGRLPRFLDNPPLVHSDGDDPDRPRLRAASNGRARSRRQRPTTRTTPSQPNPTGARRREHSDNAPRSSPRSTPLRPPVHCWPSSHDRKSPRRQRSTLKTDKTDTTDTAMSFGAGRSLSRRTKFAGPHDPPACCVTSRRA